MEWLSWLKLAWRHIGALDRLRRNPAYVEEMTPQWFSSLGAQAVILDHDGVLGPNRSEAPDKAGEKLIKNAAKAFGPGMVFILSNTRTKQEARRQSYEERFTEAIYLTARKKPDPDGLAQTAWACGSPMEKIAVIDDGLLTGALMALSAGAIPVYALRLNMDEPIFAMGVRWATTWPQIAAVWLLGLANLRRD